MLKEKRLARLKDHDWRTTIRDSTQKAEQNVKQGVFVDGVAKLFGGCSEKLLLFHASPIAHHLAWDLLRNLLCLMVKCVLNI